jgi:hypothetical protein
MIACDRAKNYICCVLDCTIDEEEEEEVDILLGCIVKRT